VLSRNADTPPTLGGENELFTTGYTKDLQISYYLYDHLGNVRLAFSDLDGNGTITVGDIYAPDNEVVMEQHYYPFGLSQNGPWFATVHPDNAYRYNGKELDEAAGMYDYGARYYDPAIARWGQVDPLAEEYAWESPYCYVGNNPIYYTDPTGMFKTKFGAWLYKAFHGGENIVNHDGTWAVIQNTGAYKHDGQEILDYDLVTDWDQSQSGFQPMTEVNGAFVLDYNWDGSSTMTIVPQSGKLQTLDGGNDPVYALLNGRAAYKGVQGLDDAVDTALGLAKKGSANPKVREALDKGKKAHKDFAEKASKKGWETEKSMIDPKTNKKVRADAVTRSGHPVELKPNTPSGRAKGQKQIEQYERATGKKGRVIYYD